MDAAISDRDRDVFAEAHQTVLNNFSEQEQERIGTLAADLKAIIDAAKKRAQGKMSKGAGY
ncbi:MAG TPA: hypothetical protein VIH76_06360 [Candidatus Acidoferrales bacterium]